MGLTSDAITDRITGIAPSANDHLIPYRGIDRIHCLVDTPFFCVKKIAEHELIDFIACIYYSLSMTTIDQYQDRAEDLRADRPVYWAILRGRSDIRKIRLLTLLSDEAIKSQLKQLAKDKMIIQDKVHKHVFRIHPDLAAREEVKGMRKYLEDLEYSYASIEGFDFSRGDISTHTYQRLREERAEANGSTAGQKTRGSIEYYDNVLTVKQAQTLLLCHEVNDGQPFRPVELGKAQGYSGQGYVKGTLIALQKKGFLVEVPARVQTWRCTSSGVDKAEEIGNSGKVERLA